MARRRNRVPTPLGGPKPTARSKDKSRFDTDLYGGRRREEAYEEEILPKSPENITPAHMLLWALLLNDGATDEATTVEHLEEALGYLSEMYHEVWDDRIAHIDSETGAYLDSLPAGKKRERVKKQFMEKMAEAYNLASAALEMNYAGKLPFDPE